MKVYSRPLNDGEMFCTSIKAAKSVFQNTEVKLCFGEFGRQYNPYKNEFGYGYYKKNIKGTVVASMILHPGVNSPLLGFYVVKSYSISDSMKDYFEKDILYKLATEAKEDQIFGLVDATYEKIPENIMNLAKSMYISPNEEWIMNDMETLK